MKRNDGPDKVAEQESMNIHQILDRLPHRYPFLLIDRVVSYSAGESLTAIKNVTYNEPYFVGHFPARPVMPGVLLLDAMTQATGILAFRTSETLPSDGTLYYLVGIDKARFKQPVEPGDQIVIEVTLTRSMRNIWFFGTEARVEGKLVASADMMCAAKEIAD
jgi:3-hydroxyacyl-[acyl-carrier-protein] dehydratase